MLDTDDDGEYDYSYDPTTGDCEILGEEPEPITTNCQRQCAQVPQHRPDAGFCRGRIAKNQSHGGNNEDDESVHGHKVRKPTLRVGKLRRSQNLAGNG